MKKILLALLAVFMLFAFVSCDEKVDPPADDNPTLGKTVLPETYHIQIHVLVDNNPDETGYIDFYKTSDGFAIIFFEEEGYKAVKNGESSMIYLMEEGEFDGGAPIPVSVYDSQLADYSEAFDFYFDVDDIKAREDLTLTKKDEPMCGDLFKCNVYTATLSDGVYEIAFTVNTHMPVYFRGPGQKSGWDISVYETTNVKLPE